MTRGVTSGTVAALAAPFYPALLAKADWPSGTERMHTGLGSLSWDSQTWLGLGPLVDWDVPAEGRLPGGGGAAVRFAATLEAMADELGQVVRGSQISVWLALTATPGGAALLAGTTPFLVFTGTVQGREAELRRAGPEALEHALTYSLSMGPPMRARVRLRHSHEDQVSQYPADTGFRLLQGARRAQFNPYVW